MIAALLAAVAGFGLWRRTHPSGWVAIAPGVELRMLSASDDEGSVAVTALRAPAAKIRVLSGDNLVAPDWRARENALAAVNGGFFDPQEKPLGLIIHRSRRAGRLRHVSGGVFFIENGAAHILPVAAFARRLTAGARITEALQCSPLLVTAGQVSQLKPQSARRTGIGVQPDGKVVIAVADDDIALPAWAKLWAASGGLDCRDALNLDGGPSTQLSVRAPGRRLEIVGGWSVPDVILVIR